MDKEIFDELNRVADGFWNDKKILNQIKINENDDFYGFRIRFDKALNDFLKIRRLDVENRDSSFDTLLDISPTKEFYEAYDKFLNVVSFAKSNDLIIDNEIIKELDELKQNKHKNDKLMEVKDNMIEQLKTENKGLQDKIDIAIATYGTLKKILYGDKNESEVKEDV